MKVTNCQNYILDELLQLSAQRRAQLEDAIKLYSFFAECDDFDKWIKDKEKMLRADDSEDSVDTAKRKYEVRRQGNLNCGYENILCAREMRIGYSEIKTLNREHSPLVII